MAYVTVPKDFSMVARKQAFGLTVRQIVAVIIAGVVCLPLYFLLQPVVGEFALYIIILIATPVFLMGFYKSKDGRKLERIILNYINVRYKKPRVRPYQTQNIYRNVSITNEIQEVLEIAQANNEDKENRPIQNPTKKFKKKDNKAREKGKG